MNKQIKWMCVLCFFFWLNLILVLICRQDKFSYAQQYKHQNIRLFKTFVFKLYTVSSLTCCHFLCKKKQNKKSWIQNKKKRIIVVARHHNERCEIVETQTKKKIQWHKELGKKKNLWFYHKRHKSHTRIFIE